MPINAKTGSALYDQALAKTASHLNHDDRRLYLRKSAKAARKYLRVNPDAAVPEPSLIEGVCGYCKQPMRLHLGPDFSICPCA